MLPLSDQQAVQCEAVIPAELNISLPKTLRCTQRWIIFFPPFSNGMTSSVPCISKDQGDGTDPQTLTLSHTDIIQSANTHIIGFEHFKVESNIFLYCWSIV